MGESRVHYCSKQIAMAVEEDKLEPPSGKCRCRKYIPLTEATQRVERGEATWTVIKRVHVTEDICNLCKGDKEVVNCAGCRGTGKQEVNGVMEVYGSDIVLVSRPDLDEKRRKHRAIVLDRSSKRKKPAVKTPRTPTIESKHILRAYVSDRVKDFVAVASRQDGVWTNEDTNNSPNAPLMYTRERTSPSMAADARQRIEDYGVMILEARAFVGPEKCAHAPDKKCTRCGIEGRIPAIKPEPENNFQKAEGRLYDYGRAI